MMRWTPCMVMLMVAFAVNLFCSCLSPLYRLDGCCDTAMFYMVGKAWYYGMLPYVDVIDVKGPLLFLLYRIGYALSPGGTMGCYMLYSLLTFCTFVFLYKTARVYSLTRWQSLLAVLVSLVFLYETNSFSEGGKSEEITRCMIAGVMYGTCLIMKSYSLKSIRVGGVLIGFGAVVCLLVKYNACVPVFVAFVCIACALIRRKNWRWLGQFVLSVIMAALCVLIPMCVYLHSLGILVSCYDVYVTFNLQTLQGVGTLTLPNIVSIITKVVQFPDTIVVFAGLIGIVQISTGEGEFGKKEARVILSIITLSILAACIVNYRYYIQLISPVGIFGCIAVCRNFSKDPGLVWRCLLVTFISLIVVPRVSGKWPEWAAYRLTQRLEPSFAAADRQIAEVKHAKIMYYGMLDCGLGVKSEALPACAEWTYLNGATPEYGARHEDAVRRRCADFIITRDDDGALLRASGYECCCFMKEPHSTEYEIKRGYYMWKKISD